MDYQQLMFFREVTKNGNISKTADQLFVSRQTISAALGRLEEELGYTLLTRGKNGVELTSDGKLFSSRIESFFLSGEQLMQDMADYGRSYRIPLKIGMTPCLEYPLYHAVEQWQTDHPELQVTIEQLPGKKSTERLIEGTLDVALTLMPSYANSGFLSEIVAEYPLCLAVHRDHPLARKESVAYTDLVGETILSTTLGYGDMEYEGQEFMPYAPDQFHYVYSEDMSLSLSKLIYNQGVMLCRATTVADHIDCLKVIPFEDGYTFPIFLRISDQTSKKKEYDRIIHDLKKALIQTET